MMKKLTAKSNEKGTAIVIALLILTLLTAFVALAVTRTTNETVAASNDAAESRAFSAAQGGLEVMTRNFDKIFEEKLSPAPADLSRVESLLPPGFEDYEFSQSIKQTKNTETVVMSGQLLQGLNALRDEWQIDATATEKATGVQVALRRQFYNNRVPIFQFGIFYDDDLEFHPGPRFDFGGRVHSNGNMFLMAQTGLYFSSRVSAAGQVLTDVGRNGRPWTTWNDNVYIKNGAGTYVRLNNTMGSVLKNPASGDPVFGNPDMPTVYRSANWENNKALFQGNLLAEQKRLDLPLKIASAQSGNALDYIELIKRGKSVGDLYNDGLSILPVTSSVQDTAVTSKERYANKRGLRISLADSKARLPGCASGSGTNAVSGQCGIRLDGDALGQGADPTMGQARGYQPRQMADGYQATTLNGDRFHIPGREVWIKIELVGLDPVTAVLQTTDVTADILSLGVTEQAQGIYQSGVPKFVVALPIAGAPADSRSIVKLQRWIMPGVGLTSGNQNFTTEYTWNGTVYNIVFADDCGSDFTYTACTAVDNGFTGDKRKYAAVVDDITKARRVVPFPIKLFDTREGLYNDDINTSSVYPGGNVPRAGVMSLIDIDVANLRRFLDGQFNSAMPVGGTPFTTAKGRALQHSDVPEANGWVLYVSDRRGDADFDGEYDMEDIYGNNDNNLQTGEDVNNNGRLDVDLLSEGVRYTGSGSVDTSPALAATVDHQYYRRGVRLINGTRLPGLYDSANSLNTKGFTVASENAVYVQGNYNATGISAVGSPTAATSYQPQNTAAHVPASIVADAITILSNNWQDSRSFRFPFTLSSRPATETTVRFALLAGDARSSYEAAPNQGGGDPRLTGGVHNFKRFLETWGSGGVRLNYAGSLINLYNARNNNGAFKCCAKVYSPPARNWVFDTSFLDPSRLPPGTPFFQNIQLTGFQRVN